MNKKIGSNYLIFDDGRVFSNYVNRFIGYKDKDGYYVVDIDKKKEFIHVLVFENFGELPNDYNRTDYDIHHSIDKEHNGINDLCCLRRFDHISGHNSGEKNPFYGKKHPDWLMKQIAEKNKGISRNKGENNPMAIITDNERHEIIQKIIKIKKEGKFASECFRILSLSYPLKAGGIEKIWKTFRKKVKSITGQ